MSEQSVVLKKRRLFVGRIAWMFGGFMVLAVIGVMIQLRMTWSREQMRGITSDAEDAITIAKTGVVSVKLDSNPFEPILRLFRDMNETTSQ